MPAIGFKTHVNKEIISQFYPAHTITEIGALALKTKYLNGGKLHFEGGYTYGGVKRTAKLALLWNKNYNFPEDGNFKLTLTNILSRDYGNDYSYRPYIKLKKDNEEIIIYGEQYDASLADVALLAVNAKKTNGGFIETDECRNLIEERFLSLLTPTELSVLNDKAYINTDFFGANWAVYHGTTYMDCTSGRKCSLHERNW